jgi:hypothetical protein
MANKFGEPRIVEMAPEVPSHDVFMPITGNENGCGNR